MNFFKNPLFVYDDFRYLYTGKLMSLLCDRFFVITISWWLLHMNIENRNSLIGIIMGAAMVANILGGPFMGTYADRYDKKKCMIISLIVPMTLLILLLSLFSSVSQYPYTLIIFYFFMSITMPLMMSASTSGLAMVVPKNELGKAVAMDGSIMFIGQAIGSTLAGALVMAVGVTGAIGMEVMFYLLAILFIWRIKTCFSNRLNQQDAQEVKRDMGAEMKEGLMYFRTNTFVMSLVILFCLANFFMSPMMMALPIITTDVLQGTALDMSILEFCFAFGAIFVSFVFGSIKVDLPIKKILPIVFLGSGVLLLLIAKSTSFYLMTVCLFILGNGVGLVNATVMGKMQEVVPDYLKGRVFSLVMMTSMAMIPIALILTGILSDLYGIMTVILINGIAMGLIGVISYLLLKDKAI